MENVLVCTLVIRIIATLECTLIWTLDLHIIGWKKAVHVVQNCTPNPPNFIPKMVLFHQIRNCNKKDPFCNKILSKNYLTSLGWKKKEKEKSPFLRISLNILELSWISMDFCGLLGSVELKNMHYLKQLKSGIIENIQKLFRYPDFWSGKFWVFKNVSELNVTLEFLLWYERWNEWPKCHSACALMRRLLSFPLRKTDSFPHGQSIIFHTHSFKYKTHHSHKQAFE